jgi:Carboxypeptidase regulatory-like domain
MRLALRTGFAFVAAILLCVSPEALFGQAVNGSLVGTVTDSSGAVVPTAKVTLTDVNTSVSRSAQTDAAGYYSFPDVPPGTYKLTVEQAGFKTVIRSGVEVPVNATVRVDLTLQVGEVTQQISVTESAPLLQTETAQTGGTVSAQQVSQLPLGTNRNFQNLVLLIPGTNGTADYNHSRFFNAQNTLNTEVNGTSSLSNNFQIEGVNDNERTGLLQVYVPAAEAIHEVNVSSSNYDAEQGTALGAVVNVIYKSGTNQFHGELYEIYKGSALNARSFFSRGKNGAPFVTPHLVNNYFGGNIGGPIRKDKTFFFFNYLHVGDHEGQFQSLSVPTAAMRNGDFSDPALKAIYDSTTGDTADCLPGGNASLCGTGRTQFVASADPNSPNYNAACTDAAGCPNIIPTARLDPISRKLIALVPMPNNNQEASGTAKYQNNYLESTRFTQDINQYDAKIDHYQGDNNHISGHLGYESPTTYQAPAYGNAGGPVSGSFEGTGTDKTVSADIAWDHIFSPTLITQNRVGLNRYRNVAQQTDYGTDASSAIGIPGVNTEPFTSGLTGVNGSGFSDNLLGYSASLPWIRAETDISFVSNWNKTKNNHTIKWGANLIRIRDDLLQEQTFSPRGLWTFGTSQSSAPGQSTNFGNQFASFMLGVPSTVGRDLPVVFPTYRQWQFFAYVNDKWQVSPKLSVDYGVRWEFYKPATPQFPGGFSNYDPTNNTLVIAGVGGNPLDVGMQKRWKDFAPRLGVAYRVTSHDVLRAGFGISFEGFEDNSYAYNFPVKQNNSFTNYASFGPAILTDGTPATFEKGFPPPLVATIPSNGIIQANTPLLINQSYVVIPKNYRDPYVESWNLTYERVLPARFVLDVAYVGNRGVALPLQYNLNAISNPALMGLGSNAQPEYGFCVPGTTTCRTAATTQYFAGVSSKYNSLQVKLDHHFSGGFTTTTAYTWSKAMGYVEENGENSSGPKYYIRFQRNYARTDVDRTNVLVQSFVWNLPFGKGQRWLNQGIADKVLGGWEFSGIARFLSGTPLDFGCTCQGINTPGNGQSPWVTAPISKLYGIDTQPWFDTTVFQDPTKFFGKPTFGNVGRYILAGPNIFNLDASLFKTFRVTEKLTFEFRTEWFSALNNPQFGSPDVNLGDSTFGLVKSAGGNRNIDFGGRLIF